MQPINQRAFGQVEPIPGVREIAVLRANGLGDFIFAIPALEALRAAYPGARLTLLGLPWHERFLADRPGPVHRAWPVPRWPGVGAPEGTEPGPEAASFFERCRGERLDLALQLHGGGRNSNPFVLRLGARVTAGLRAEDAPALDRWMRYVYYQPEILRLLEAVALVGAAPVSLEPSIAVTAADLAEAAPVVTGLGRPFAVLHPGAGDPRRRWPTANFAAVGRALLAAGCALAITGSGDEGAACEAVAAALAGKAVNLYGALSLGGFAGLVSQAAVVVSNDSGPLHLAMAVGAPAVGIYWCGNLINATPATRQLARPVLSYRVDCATCGRNVITDDCGHRGTFVDLASAEEVTWHALDVLGLARA